MNAKIFGETLLALLIVVSTTFAPAWGQTYTGYSGHQVPIEATQQQSQFERLPSYPYDPQLDPANIPRTQPQRDVQDSTSALATIAGLDLGLQVSDYQYEEPSLNVRLTGPKVGFTATATGTLSRDWFIVGDVRGAFGYSDYSGSGTHDGNFEDLWDVRGLIGKDFIFQTFDLSPTLGVGYRDFFSDERGISSTGAHGYRRENQLIYIPVGIEPRFRVSSDARIATHLEYDYVVLGHQTSMLRDADAGYPNITNTQKSGYGLRGDIMWEEARWSAGPFVDYWSIQQSDTVCAIGSAYGFCGYEPTNHTIEGGVQVRYRFF